MLPDCRQQRAGCGAREGRREAVDGSDAARARSRHLTSYTWLFNFEVPQKIPNHFGFPWLAAT